MGNGGSGPGASAQANRPRQPPPSSASPSVISRAPKNPSTRNPLRRHATNQPTVIVELPAGASPHPMTNDDEVMDVA